MLPSFYFRVFKAVPNVCSLPLCLGDCLSAWQSELTFSKLCTCIYNGIIQHRFYQHTIRAIQIQGRLCKHHAERSAINLQCHTANVHLSEKAGFRIRIRQLTTYSRDLYKCVIVNPLKTWKDHSLCNKRNFTSVNHSPLIYHCFFLYDVVTLMSNNLKWGFVLFFWINLTVITANISSSKCPFSSFNKSPLKHNPWIGRIHWWLKAINSSFCLSAWNHLHQMDTGGIWLLRKCNAILVEKHSTQSSSHSFFWSHALCCRQWQTF